MPFAKDFGYGASLTNYCCPTDELIRPLLTGNTVENECAACYTTTLSNCGNYGENPRSFFFNFIFKLANFQMVCQQSMKIFPKILEQIPEWIPLETVVPI